MPYSCKCNVRGCENSGPKKDTSYFRVPVNDKVIKGQWLNFLSDQTLVGKEEKDLHKYRVCSDHFEEKFISVGFARKTLVPSAVPTLFPPPGSASQQVAEANTGKSAIMVRHATCMVEGCTLQNQPKTSFHKFTNRDPEIKRQWLVFVDNEKYCSMDQIKQSLFICHHHFEDKYISMFESKRRLVQTAVPTLFPPPKSDERLVIEMPKESPVTKGIAKRPTKRKLHPEEDDEFEIEWFNGESTNSPKPVSETPATENTAATKDDQVEEMEQVVVPETATSGVDVEVGVEVEVQEVQETTADSSTDLMEVTCDSSPETQKDTEQKFPDTGTEAGVSNPPVAVVATTTAAATNQQPKQLPIKTPIITIGSINSNILLPRKNHAVKKIVVPLKKTGLTPIRPSIPLKPRGYYTVPYEHIDNSVKPPPPKRLIQSNTTTKINLPAAIIGPDGTLLRLARTIATQTDSTEQYPANLKAIKQQKSQTEGTHSVLNDVTFLQTLEKSCTTLAKTMMDMTTNLTKLAVIIQQHLNDVS